MSRQFNHPTCKSFATNPTTQITRHFAKTKLLARCHNRASPEMFARLMKLDQLTAKGVYAMLKARKARDFAQVSSDASRRLREMARKRVEGWHADATKAAAPQTEDDAARLDN